MFVLPDLPYDYDALEPTVSSDTVTVHHDKHHKAYVDTVNKLLAETQPEHALLSAGPQSQAQADGVIKLRIGLVAQPGEGAIGGGRRADPGSVGANTGLALGRKILESDGVVQHAYRPNLRLKAQRILGPGRRVALVEPGGMGERDVDGRLDPGQALGLVSPDIGDQKFAVRRLFHRQGRQVHAPAGDNPHLGQGRGLALPLGRQPDGGVGIADLHPAQVIGEPVEVEIQTRAWAKLEQGDRQPGQPRWIGGRTSAWTSRRRSGRPAPP